MKKFLLPLILFVPFLGSAQQHTADFENLTLATDSYYNGSDNAGGFTSGNAYFENSYDTTYSMWSAGFGYSNMRDDSTAGYTNMYSAYPAKGSNNSSNYGIYLQGYDNRTINFSSLVKINSLQISNTTYAYLSMLNGDAFAKKFGDSLDAAGNVDGTDGKDYFFVRIYALDTSNTELDSVDIYLADFRSNDPSQHFILDTWKEVSLNLTANKLSFAMFSSDNGTYGMNTPGYFTIDDLKFTEETTGIENITAQTVTVYPNPTTNELSVTNYEGEANIYGMNGRMIKSVQIIKNQSIDVSQLTQGIYQIVTPTSAFRFIKK